MKCQATWTERIQYLAKYRRKVQHTSPLPFDLLITPIFPSALISVLPARPVASASPSTFTTNRPAPSSPRPP